MTSLFESYRPAPEEMAVELVKRGGRGIALLEFMAVERPQVEDGAAAAESAGTERNEEGEESFGGNESAARTRAMIDAARDEAASEARRALEAEFEERMKHEKRRVERLLAEFSTQRQSYFAQAEVAVVRLALSVAAKVLQREANADLMHLSATVRAALSRVQDGSNAIIRVRPDEVDAWKQLFAEEHDGKVEVAGDKAMRIGDLVLETTIGRVELGVVAQLGEIERGFRELMDKVG